MTTSYLVGRPIRFSAVGLDHAHVFGQIEGLLGQGCELAGFSSDDESAAVARTVRERWPHVEWIRDAESLLSDPSIDLIVERQDTGVIEPRDDRDLRVAQR